MSTANVVNREPVELPVLAGLDEELWSVLLELAEARVHGWTLIGGQMVLMHALENRTLPAAGWRPIACSSATRTASPKPRADLISLA